jgi:hypothetical protein
MKNYKINTDKLVFATDTPDIPYLYQEYLRSTQNGGNTANIAENDDIRLSRWAGQTDDGKKHSENRPEGDPAFPWEGASDVRCRIIDRTINELVALLMTTFDRSQVKVKGTEYNDFETSATANVLMSWLLESKLRSEIRKEAELLAQYGMQYGWTALNVTWEQETAIRHQKLSIEEIAQAVAIGMQNNPESPLKDLPEAILNPEQEDYAASLIMQYMPTLKERDVKKAVRDLRTKGFALIPEVFISKNIPSIVALKPYDEISFPPETIDIQKARVIFRRTFVTEVELRSMAAQYDWSAEFVEQAVNTAGMQSQFNDPNLLPAAALINYQVSRNDNLIELVYAYSRSINEDNVQAIYQTIFCPQSGSEVFASHEILGYAHNKYPFVVYRRERIRRPIYETRGVPEIAMTDQEEIKAQRDAIRDQTAITTLPPIMVKKRQHNINKISPGMQLPVTTPDDYRFMPTPIGGNNATAFNLIDRVEMEHSAYFGLYHPNILPAKTQTTQQFVVNNWLDVWSEAFSMTFSLMLQYMEAAEIEQITGRSLPQNASSISNNFDFQIKYDVREIDTEFVIEKLKAIAQFVLPIDSTGVIDKAKLVKAAVEAIDPDKAKDLIINTNTASQLLYKEIQSDIGLMMLGNEANYVENDPSAETKMQYLQDILSKNPKAQQQMQSDPHFRALMENFIKNLQMSVMQRQNAQIGRTGVTPIAEQAGNAMQGQIDEANEMQKQQEAQAPEQEGGIL